MRASFIEEWTRLTEWIRSEFEGARGSTLVEPTDGTGGLVGIARWTSTDPLRDTPKMIAAKFGEPEIRKVACH